MGRSVGGSVSRSVGRWVGGSVGKYNMYVLTLFSDGKNLVTKVIFPRAVLLVKVSIIICITWEDL